MKENFAEIYTSNNEKLNSHENVMQMCTTVLKNKYSFYLSCINYNPTKREYTIDFRKTFERNFFQKLFGPKKVVYTGELICCLNIVDSCHFVYKAEWRKFYDNNRYEVAENDEFTYSVDSHLIVNDITQWKPEY